MLFVVDAAGVLQYHLALALLAVVELQHQRRQRIPRLAVERVAQRDFRRRDGLARRLGGFFRRVSESGQHTEAEQRHA
jgi:hypothetical protein